MTLNIEESNGKAHGTWNSNCGEMAVVNGPFLSGAGVALINSLPLRLC